MPKTPPLREAGSLYTTRDVAELFQVSLDTVRRWAQDGHLDGFKSPGNQWRFTEQNVHEFHPRLGEEA